MNYATKSPHIFLIEDDADLCQGWADVFDLLGYTHHAHHRGLTALQDVEGIRKADVVITDFYLPDINGVDLLRRMREIEPGLRSIVLTGSREATVVQAVNKLGNCVLLHKPLNIDTLETEIAKLTQKPVA